MRELELEAQRRGEMMLEAVYREAHQDFDDDYEHNGVEPEGIVCEGPCETCIVREILNASWPVMAELARRDQLEAVA